MLVEGILMKQIIVMRTDLNMRKGKMIAQGAHASMKATLANIYSPYVISWLNGLFTKVVVRVDSEAELLDVYERALEAGLISEMIEDSGLTEFHGVPTKTCIAVGPAPNDELQPITGHLELL